jgi:hypothetical protein
MRPHKSKQKVFQRFLYIPRGGKYRETEQKSASKRKLTPKTKRLEKLYASAGFLDKGYSVIDKNGVHV